MNNHLTFHTKQFRFIFFWVLPLFGLFSCNPGTPISTLGIPAQLDIRQAGANSIRVTLSPIGEAKILLDNPALAEQKVPKPKISLLALNKKVVRDIGKLRVEVTPDPLTVLVTNKKGEKVQKIVFSENGNLGFDTGEHPVLGMGEGGPLQSRDEDWRQQKIEFDRRGRLHKMEPRWQNGVYGSRNPVPLMIGTEGWALFVAAPWGQIDLQEDKKGVFQPWNPNEQDCVAQTRVNQQERRSKGRPPCASIIEGQYDLFIFDAHDPEDLMKDLSDISGHAKMPPKWALGYMQSHRTLEDETQMIDIVRTFREKEIPLDAVIYLGTEFCPRGWNTYQPSFDFNPEVFHRQPEEVLSDLHNLDVKAAVHMVPWDRDRLASLHGSIPPKPNQILDESHISSYWEQHVEVVRAGVDAFWPDEGDWLDLHERIKRHQLYYEGPISTTPNVRPWSLHRNGYLGIAKWGGWVWSGDTRSAWKTLEAQIAVGINHSLSISPYWGSDIGGFYPNAEKTGELYVRWFQFGAFCPSFRSHGRTWHTSLPWGFGLSDMGVREPNRTNDLTEEGALARAPLASSMNDQRVEPITRKYAELRYQLMPYTYTLSWEARQSGMPLMRALWLHYPGDENVRDMGDEYLWGRDILIAPVYEEGATSRQLYLPEGDWYDWWNNEKFVGGQKISRKVDLETMPIYVRAGAIIPFDPVRQFTAQLKDEPMTIKIFDGAYAEFILYEDDGISLDYLEGQYSTIKFSWDDREKALKIEPGRVGLAAQKNRTFKIDHVSSGSSQMIDYRGAPVKVIF